MTASHERLSSVPGPEDRAERDEVNQVMTSLNDPGPQLAREQLVRQAGRRDKSKPQQDSGRGSRGEGGTSITAEGLDRERHGHRLQCAAPDEEYPGHWLTVRLSLGVLPMAFHHTGKKVFGPNQIEPLIMLNTTHASTAVQRIVEKSM